MKLTEVVIDGTNFGGKTPLVSRLLEELRQRGYRVETAAPYREGEVYQLWDSEPVTAAATIVERMRTHRERASDADVFIWDRGWPTCFVCTRNESARQLFLPLQPLTFLLLNTAETTEKKVRKYAIPAATHPWMHRQRLRDEISYETLAQLWTERLLAFRPTLEDSRFDLELLSAEIIRRIEEERAASPG